jgi:hypothetical protein
MKYKTMDRSHLRSVPKGTKKLVDAAIKRRDYGPPSFPRPRTRQGTRGNLSLDGTPVNREDWSR